MSECKLCRQGDPSINVRCWSCRELFHIHQVQLDEIEEGDVVLVDCPSCGAGNCWLKRGKGVVFSGPVIYNRERIKDLRGK
ncbi:hypothetical protein ES708_14111 [subsurface metagenome]